jgi:hypothetical protein
MYTYESKIYVNGRVVKIIIILRVIIVGSTFNIQDVSEARSVVKCETKERSLLSLAHWKDYP